jgi:hypothetical protein
MKLTYNKEVGADPTFLHSDKRFLRSDRHASGKKIAACHLGRMLFGRAT